MTSRRRLIVMRHAKAEPFAATDHERTLTDRGRRDARAVGVHLATTEVVPDHAVVSSAARTVGTWEAVADGARSRAKATLDDMVYAGDADALLESLQATPPEAGVVIIVGHNPAVASLAHLLDDGHGEAAAMREMAQGYPPSAVTVLEVDVPWSDLGAESGRVVDFYVGGG